MAGLKIFLALSLLSVVSTGHLGRFQPGYSAFGANAYTSASASASAFTSASASAYTYGAHLPILNYGNENNGDGTYRYSYETGNGISAHESGAPRAAGAEGSAVTADGGFSYRTPDGQQVSLTYTADENGFHPVGSHIPTPPPIPEAILRSIELNRQNPSTGDSFYNGHFHHGHY